MSSRNSVFTGALLALTAVIFGAFGAHGLEKILEPHALEIFKTGTTYQMTHALALILFGIWQRGQTPAKGLGALAPKAFAVGILLFSGSLYILAISGIKTFGMVAPFGGLSLMLGWMAFAWAAYQTSEK